VEPLRWHVVYLIGFPCDIMVCTTERVGGKDGSARE